jgi:SAM-dependent methyltransferase
MASQCLAVAAELGIADLLAGGARGADELAAATGTHPDALRRLLRALAALGLMREEEPGRFLLAPAGEPLRRGGDGSLREEILQMLHPTSWASWGALAGSVKTGAPAFPTLFGADAWSWRAAHPEAGAAFDAMAERNSRRAAESLLAHLDLEGVECVVDVGGGTGGLLAGILARRPGLRGILLDRPEVVAAAPALLEAAGVADRCRVEGGDFLAAVPSGGDLYLLRGVLHDWDDAAAATILRNCRRAIPPAGRLVIVEALLEPGAPPATTLLDLHMLLLHGGRERNAEGFRALLESTGFRLASIRGTGGAESLVVGAPP